MPKNGKTHAPTNDAKARQLVDYARIQAEPTLQAQLAGKPCELPADLFPGYTIVTNVSRGGQGRVYEAIDNSTQRRVAIKTLRSGPFGGEVELGRFEREIQILAQLQHPNIVTIHNSGTVALQRYFVMDFIEGQALDEYFAGDHLTIEQTLTLFLRICEAVNAAHLRGIVHRDLKPGNIRIDSHGEPHVLDFGLAKMILEQADGTPGSSDATVAGQFVGSLPWAAPEQVMNTPEAVDLRTDVYGLGLLLYFMLTNSFPYDRRANLRDMMDSILRSVPTPPRSLRREIDDELNTIILMCLHKEPDRRYQIAGELARDIKRYRAGEPIEAKRDSAGYLLAKTIRRHRGLAMLAGALVLISTGFAVTMSVLYQKAAASEQLAEERAADVSEQYAVTREAIGFLVDEVSSKLNETPGNMHVKRDILEGAFERLLPLVELHSDDPELQRDVMRTHYQLGDIAIALIRFEKAQQHLQAAMDLRLRLSPEASQSPEELADLSINYVLLGDVAQRASDEDACERWYRAALVIDEELVDAYPGNSHFLDNLAWSYNRLSCYADSVRNDLSAAKELALKQLEIMLRLVHAEPDNAIRLHGLSAAHDRLIKLAEQFGDSVAAAHHAELRLAISSRMIAAAPDDPFFLSNHILAVSHHFFKTSGLTPEERVDGLMRARGLVERLLELEPDVPRNHFVRLQVSDLLRRVASNAGNEEQAVAAAHEAIDGAVAYAELAPPDLEIVSRHAAALIFFRNMSLSQGNAERAKSFHGRACEAYEQGLASDPKSQYMPIELLHLRLEDPDPNSIQRQEIIAEARRISPSIELHDTRSLIQLGMLFARAEEHELAIELLTRAQDHLSPQGAVLPHHALKALEECRAAARE